MTVIFCIDDKGGMLFNKRRQSRDRVVTADMLELAREEGKILSVSPFSEKLFAEAGAEVRVLGDIVSEAKRTDICFVEDIAPTAFGKKVSRLVVYKWNRAYPADFYADTDLSQWKLTSSEELSGYSHEKITKEIYVR